MIILRFFLFFVCILSIGWSVLVFASPPILKRFISGYSDGAISASDITISPMLDISIGRIDFAFKNELSEIYFKGFARATKISWSLFGEKPFLEINFGPTFLKDYVIADNINVRSLPYRDLDWPNIVVTAKTGALDLFTFGKINALTLEANLNLGSSKISNVYGEADMFTFDSDSSTWSSDKISGKLGELNLNHTISEQPLNATFVIEQMAVSDLNMTISEGTFEVALAEGEKNFQTDLHDVRFLDFGGFLDNIKADGSYSPENILQYLNINFLNGVLASKGPSFSSIFSKVINVGSETYKANIYGDLDEFDISNSENFLGSLPQSNFEIDFEFDKKTSKTSASVEIAFDEMGGGDIDASAQVAFIFQQIVSGQCNPDRCDLEDFDLAYQINFGDEWIRGSSTCPEKSCDIKEINNLVTTSHTANIFTTLNSAGILNPLSALYLYSTISSGTKINGGHELKFQF